MHRTECRDQILRNLLKNVTVKIMLVVALMYWNLVALMLICLDGIYKNRRLGPLLFYLTFTFRKV